MIQGCTTGLYQHEAWFTNLKYNIDRKIEESLGHIVKANSFVVEWTQQMYRKIRHINSILNAHEHLVASTRRFSANYSEKLFGSPVNLRHILNIQRQEIHLTKKQGTFMTFNIEDIFSLNTHTVTLKNTL